MLCIHAKDDHNLIYKNLFSDINYYRAKLVDGGNILLTFWNGNYVNPPTKYGISTDNGVNWTEISISDTNLNIPNLAHIYICYDGTKFFAFLAKWVENSNMGVYTGYTSYSSDGVNWSTPITSTGLNPITPSSSSYKDTASYHKIVYGGGKYILYDDSVDWSTPQKSADFGGHTSYSSDGVNWTRTSAIFYKTWMNTSEGYQIVYNNYCIYCDNCFCLWQQVQRFNSSTNVTYNFTVLWKSTDGVNWTKYYEGNNHPSNIIITQNCITYKDKKFFFKNNQNFYVSDDGIYFEKLNYDKSYFETGYQTVESMLYKDNNFLSFEQASFPKSINFYSSCIPADSYAYEDWTNIIALPDTADSYYSSLCYTSPSETNIYIPKRFLFITYDGKIYKYNVGDSSWTYVTQLLWGGNEVVRGWTLYYNGTDILAIQQYGNISKSSDYGDTWSSVITNTGLFTDGWNPADYYTLCYGNGKWVAISTDGRVSTSTDGTTWNAFVSRIPSVFVDGSSYIRGAITFDGNKFVVCEFDSLLIHTSTDGVNWNTVTSICPNLPYVRTDNYTYEVNFGNLIWNGNYYLLIGIKGCMLKSYDLINWELVRYDESRNNKFIKTIYTNYSRNDNLYNYVAASFDSGQNYLKVASNPFTSVHNNKIKTLYTFDNGNKEYLIK